MNSFIRPFKENSLNNMNDFYFKMDLNNIRYNFSVERGFFFFSFFGKENVLVRGTYLHAY